ncbi:HDIG domain-containing protein, partial [Candidatus Bathyarchaeota archaeon]|nr:HDIG domain-containing protein [Candidatus Bathyarchaeota archaeon]
ENPIIPLRQIMRWGCRMLDPKIRSLVEKIRDRKLRKKVADLLNKPSFLINGKEYLGVSLEVSPAGLSHHHSYLGGFTEHVVSAGTIALAMCDCVEEVYGGVVNRDLVVAGILLHDVFKPLTYKVDEDGYYSSTRLADYLDHSSLIVSELVRRDFPLELVHIVAAHHGGYGAVRPRTVEALICHLADLVDSRLNGDVLNAASYLVRRIVGEELPALSSKEAFEIVHCKAAEGEDGVRKAYRRIVEERKARKT